MTQKIIANGAEAAIIRKGKSIIKRRIGKSYRLPILDEKLRKLRTRSETKILQKINSLIPTPKVINSNENTKEIILEFIPGKKLSENMEKLNYSSICTQIGKNLAIIHDNNIIHGDLTTSNMIFHNKKVYFIDFGLGFHSARIEDKAVDLHLIKEALEAKHPSIHEKAFNSILKGYKHSTNYKKTLSQLQKVEMRGRYKTQY